MSDDWCVILDRLAGGVQDVWGSPECQTTIELVLPKRELLMNRNAAISGSYAAMYLRHPRLFKWAGMAAFASQHVRKVIALLDEPHLQGPQSKALSRMISNTELEVIRSTNNAIFNDIYWTHAVYDGTQKGFNRLVSLLDNTPRQGLLDGFDLIEKGRQLIGTDAAESERLIWQGNVQLLWHEQEQVVQPSLSQLSGSFARVFSLGSSLNYEPGGMIDCMKYCSSFYLFMLTRHPGLLVRSGGMPRLNKLDQRWMWITTVLIPNFQSLEKDSAEAKLQVIAKNGLSAIACD